ncbi:hypothetical protein COV04_01170 [Candidatus Uhrbacteria bacterium CG10_big_fil_rev_8_21_14_0_10_48_11]|uniref:Cation-transporting P-type ATPase N-terminal domain-containing protein n=1 Tax=Candidatus Uhrbacteria bacterium CG10_big_fil_rev_8_21_14_0_10_48_11 TaxID=1975037 RepID=A0A2M8LFA1_9BACT|nr:MAG: hypothetical protein COV04_01170 [Candidatus Uhrbacteria bacterium CG10_big_fil_rev_8_21_14_0_10_48_11]
MVTAVSIGLRTEEAETRLERFGKNEVAEHKKSIVASLAKWFFSPIALMLLSAIGLSLFAGRTSDAGIIAALLILNFGISGWHEHKADTAVAKLRDHLHVFVSVIRDGKEVRIDSTDVVPGDIIRLTIGNIVPADVVF